MSEIVETYKPSQMAEAIRSFANGFMDLEFYDYSAFDGNGRIQLPFTINADYTITVVYDTTFINGQGIIGNTSGNAYCSLTHFYKGNDNPHEWLMASYGYGNGAIAKGLGAAAGKHKFVNNLDNKSFLDDQISYGYTPTTNGGYLIVGGCQNNSNFNGKIYEYKIESISTGNVICHLKPGKVYYNGVLRKVGLIDVINFDFYSGSFLTVGNDE